MEKEGIAIALIVLSVIIVLAGVANAVFVTLDVDRAYYSRHEDSATVNIGLNIDAGEVVPFRSIVVSLDGVPICEFDLDGIVLSGCDGMSIYSGGAIGIPPFNRQTEFSTNMTGAGYGFNGSDYGNYTTYFGYGYGYSLPMGFTIVWNLTNLPDNAYELSVGAVAEQDTRFVYMPVSTAQLNIFRAKPTVSIIVGDTYHTESVNAIKDALDEEFYVGIVNENAVAYGLDIALIDDSVTGNAFLPFVSRAIVMDLSTAKALGLEKVPGTKNKIGRYSYFSVDLKNKGHYIVAPYGRFARGRLYFTKINQNWKNVYDYRQNVLLTTITQFNGQSLAYGDGGSTTLIGVSGDKVWFGVNDADKWNSDAFVLLIRSIEWLG